MWCAFEKWEIYTKISVGNHKGRISLERSMDGLKNNIEINLREIRCEVVGWTILSG
jgi:hypothetical protein